MLRAAIEINCGETRDIRQLPITIKGFTTDVKITSIDQRLTDTTGNCAETLICYRDKCDDD